MKRLLPSLAFLLMAVTFFASRCPPCTDEFRHLNALSASGEFDRIPTVVVYDQSGEEIWRFVHERDAEKTRATETDLRHALERARR